MARRVSHAVRLAAGPSESQLANELTQLYSNRCGARCMHWRHKQQGICCMTANGSRLTRTLRAAPSSSSSFQLAAHRGPQQGPAISISSRAQLCLARSVIPSALPPHSETYMRLFPNCRLCSREVPVACVHDRHYLLCESCIHPLPLFKRNYAAQVPGSSRGANKPDEQTTDGRSRALATSLLRITRRDTVGAHPFAPARTLIVIHSTAKRAI
jgi:hypothetical protein